MKNNYYEKQISMIRMCSGSSKLLYLQPLAVLQIRRFNRDILGIIFHIHKNICCDTSLEPSH